MPNPYGVDTRAFFVLEERVRELRDEVPLTHRLEGVLPAYLDAFDKLLDLMFALLSACASRAESRRYVGAFLEVYQLAHRRALLLLRRELEERMQREDEDLVWLLRAIHDSHIANELVVLSQALGSDAEPEAHTDTATTVTNSFKDMIKRFFRWKSTEWALHTLNEVISIVRGRI